MDVAGSLENIDPVSIGILLSLFAAVGGAVSFLFDRTIRRPLFNRAANRFRDQAKRVRDLETAVQRVEGKFEASVSTNGISNGELVDIRAQIAKLSEITKELKDEDEHSSRDLSKYYQHMLRQSNSSFYFSIIFAAIGFSVILFTILTFQKGKEQLAMIQGVSGIVIEAFSALFMLNVNSTRKSVIQFLEKLREDARNDISLKTSDEIQNDVWRDKIKVMLTTHMSGMSVRSVGSLEDLFNENARSSGSPPT